MNQALEGEGHISLTNFGYSAYQDLLPDTKQRKPLTFEQFHPFISLEGVDSKTATSFLNFLQNLFERAPKCLWSPESCCGAVEIARNARIISSNYFPKQTKINVLMGPSHLWSVVEQPDQTETVVVDPAGFWDPELEAVLPYFGVLGTCSFEGYPRMYARHVYSEGEVLTPDQEEALLKYQAILLHSI